MIVPGLVLIVGAVTIVAALKMKRLEAYGLAIAASLLAVILSPINLIGLAIGIWSLVVLCRPEVGMAFERRRRMKPAPPAATGFQRRLGRMGLILNLGVFAFSLLVVRFAVPAIGSVMALAVALGVGILALILGIIGRRSLAGKAAVLFSAFAVLFPGTLLTVGGLQLLRPVTHVEFPRGSKLFVSSDGQLTKSSTATPAVIWEMRPEGPVLSEALARDTLRLEGKKTEEANHVLQAAYREYCALEARHTKQYEKEDGHWVTSIEPFPKEMAKIEDRLWSGLDAMFTVEQQKLARYNLRLDSLNTQAGIPIADITKLGLFAWGMGSSPAQIEICAWAPGTTGG